MHESTHSAGRALSSQHEHRQINSLINRHSVRKVLKVGIRHHNMGTEWGRMSGPGTDLCTLSAFLVATYHAVFDYIKKLDKLDITLQRHLTASQVKTAPIIPLCYLLLSFANHMIIEVTKNI